MANYDGSILINTKISVKDAEAQISALEKRMVKTADTVSSLRAKMDALKGTTVPTEQYAQLQANLEKATQKLEMLRATQETLKGSGRMFSEDWKALSEQAAEAAQNISSIKAEMTALRSSGKAMQIVPESENDRFILSTLQNEVEEAKNNFNNLLEKVEKLKAEGKDSGRYWDSLNEALLKSRDYISSTEQRLAAFKEQTRFVTSDIPTEEYAQLQAHLQNWENIQKNIKGEQEKLTQSGKKFTAEWNNSAKKIREVRTEIGAIRLVMQEMERTGRATVAGEQTQEYARLAQQLREAEAEMQRMNQQHNRLNGAVRKGPSIFKRFADAAKKAFSDTNKSAKKSQGFIEKFFRRVKGLAERVFIFSFVTRFFRGIVSGIKEGFSNFYNYSESFKSSVEGLKASMLTLKNSFAAAFAPLVEIAIPYIQKLVDYITQLLGLFAQFTAALTGQKTYTKAIKQTAAATEEAKKAAQGYLSPLDEINKFQKQESSGADASGTGTMFEEAPISSKIQDMADKFKGILSDFFRPLVEAWNREGKFVMDSWKYALDEVWNLMKDIGRDFLTMWNQEATIQMFADILHIIGDIGQVVGNLAHNLDEAWNKNQVGLHILENIRDIFAIIIGHIRNAADYTVEWSKKLDFYPLLESINTLLEALKPLADNVGAGLEWFWKNVLLPIAGWTIQEAVPTFLNMLAAAIDVLNTVIETLKPVGTWLWEEFLKPLGEWAGETIITALETVTDLLYKFSDWISEHQEAVQGFAALLSIFAIAWGAVNLALGAWNVIAAIASVVTGTLGAAIAFLASPVGIAVAAIAALVAIGVLLYENWDTISEKAKEIWERIKKTISDSIEAIKTTISVAIDFVSNTISNGWNAVQTFTRSGWEMIKNTLSTAWELIKKNIFAALETIKTTLSAGWDSVKTSVSVAWGAIRDTISVSLSTIKNTLSSSLGMIKITWSNAWNGMRSSLGTALDSIKRSVKSAFDWISDKIDSLKRKLSSIKERVSGLFGSSSRASSISSYSLSYGPALSPPVPQALASLANKEFPGYATGQVIPRTMKEHLARFGDNNLETEVVSPLSTMKQAFLEAMAESGGMGGNKYDVKAYARGRALFELIIEEGKAMQQSTGNNPFLLK